MKRTVILLLVVGLAACGSGQQQHSASSKTPASTQAAPGSPAGPARASGTDAEVTKYAHSVGINIQCAKAYTAAHGGQFPQSIKDLNAFKQSAPPSTHCS